jgi:hypothetical protein
MASGNVASGKSSSCTNTAANNASHCAVVNNWGGANFWRNLLQYLNIIEFLKSNIFALK